MQVLIYSMYHHCHELLYHDIFEMTKSITEDYPRYKDWYYNTFLSDLQKGNRAYAVALYGSDLAGCTLMKNTPNEKKICTFFVAPKYRRQGIGSGLMNAAFKKLGSTPFLTVPLTKIDIFSPFLNGFGFQMEILPQKDQNAPTEALFTRASPYPVQKAHFSLLTGDKLNVNTLS